tara:strand:- start:1595 stop:2122 length:528 start_codon:yes stop_codon:yes gene_type:complete
MSNKRALIITGSMVQDHEFIYPFYRLKEDKVDVDVFNGSNQQVLGFFGTKIPPQKDDKIIQQKDIDVNKYNLLVIPGGVKAMEHMRLNKDLIEIIKKFNQEKKLIACICSGIFLMISAKIIKDKKVSGYYAWQDDIENAGGKFIDAEVVVDSNLITSPHYKYVGEWMGKVISLIK